VVYGAVSYSGTRTLRRLYVLNKAISLVLDCRSIRRINSCISGKIGDGVVDILEQAIAWALCFSESSANHRIDFQEARSLRGNPSSSQDPVLAMK